MATIKSIISEFQRCLASPNWLFSIIGYFIFLCFNLPADPWPQNPEYLFSLTYKYGFYIFFLLCGSLPYSCSFLDDLNNGYIFRYLSKESRKNYIFSKVTVVFTSAFVSIAVSSCLFLLYLYIRYSLSDSSVAISYSGWDSLITLHSPACYYTVKILLTSLFGASFSVFSLSLSSKIKNSLAVCSLSVVIFYFFNQLSTIFKIPTVLNINSILYLPIAGDNTFKVSFVLSSLILLLIAMISTFIFVFNFRSAIKSEGSF